MPQSENPAAAVVYISDLTGTNSDPADLFDLAFLLRSPEKFALTGMVLPDGDTEGVRLLDSFAARIPGAGDIAIYHGADGFREALRAAPAPVNVVVTAGFQIPAAVLRTDRALFREKVARLFLVGGHANDYTLARTAGERLPIDPRLKERHPERFAAAGDQRLVISGEWSVVSEQKVVDGGVIDASEPTPPPPLTTDHYSLTTHPTTNLAELLTSGEGVIWLPRDICLWRYAAPQLLSDGGAVCEWLLRELFGANLRAGRDRFAAADEPVLLSAIPAFLLASQPDPLGWLRLFRAVTARVETDPDGRVTNIAVKHERPNLYAVVGIDGRALGEVVTKTLRVRPLT